MVASSDTPTPSWSSTRVLLGILLLAAGLRVAVLLQAATHDPTFATWFPAQDMHAYDAWARAMLRGDWTFDPRPHAPYSPTYPVLLALVYRVLGARVTAMAGLQVALGVVTVYAVYQLAHALFRRRVAVVAALGYALYVPDWFYATRMLRASWICAAVALGAWWLVAGLRHERRAWLGAAGAAFGCAAALRPNNALLVGMALAIALWSVPRWGWRRVGALALGAIIAWGPWVLWSAVRPRMQPPVMSPGLFGLIGGNTPDATGVFYHVPPMANLIYRESGGHIGAALHGLGAAIAAEPLRWLGMQARKAVMFWHGYEPMNNVSLAITAQSVPLLRSPVLRFWPTAVLGLVGVLATWRQSRDVRTTVLLILAVYAGVVPFFILSRYRMPIVPLLLPFAAWCVVDGVAALRALAVPKRVALGVALGVALTALHPCTLPRWFAPGFVAYFEHQSALNLVVTYAHRGDTEAAVTHARALYADAPEYEPGFTQLVFLLRETGRVGEVRAVCADARARGVLSAEAQALCVGTAP